MLAYLFSHRPATGSDVAAYEDVLREFHSMLATANLRGFVHSCTYRIGDAYEDWYLLDDSAALDGLNEAAVTGAPAPSHHAAARIAVDGVGKLMSLAGGRHEADAGIETRFGKPAGMGYADLYAALAPLTIAGGAALWRRMMVLGPPPEFCLTTNAEVELPSLIRAEVVRRTRI